MRKKIGDGGSNYYLDRIEGFINVYQLQYDRKIKLKKTKKDRENENVQV